MRLNTMPAWKFWIGLGLGALALLALAFALVSPKLGELLRRDEESNSHAALLRLRESLSTHAAAHGGAYPADPSEALPEPRRLPQLRLPPHHGPSGALAAYPRRAPADTGSWGYVDAAGNPEHGALFIDCTHTDSRGSV